MINKAVQYTFSEAYDKNKKSLIFCSTNKRINDDNMFITRFLFNIADILSDEFNIFILINAKTLSKLTETVKAYPKFSYIHLCCGDIPMLRKIDVEENVDNVKINRQTVENVLKEFIEPLNVAGIYIQPPVLPSQQYFNDTNEFFDKIEIKDEKVYDNMNEINKKIAEGRLLLYTAFSTKAQAILLDMCEYFHNNHNTPIYQFIIDPGAYYIYLRDKCNAITYYFEDDNRGTRTLKEFPMGQLNYLYNYNIHEGCKDFKDKENNFIWGGAILLPKGNRINDYYTFINDFKFKDSVLHISNTNSISKGKQVPKSLQTEKFLKVIEDINNQPLNAGLLDNKAFEEKLKDYKYTLILKCASTEDSLNFRIHYSLLFNMLPIIDNQYDQANIQIPKKFKDQLVVNNSSDIEKRLEFFENNKEVADNLLKEMQDYYLNEKYTNKDWYLEQFKNKYFMEIFK